MPGVVCQDLFRCLAVFLMAALVNKVGNTGIGASYVVEINFTACARTHSNYE